MQKPVLTYFDIAASRGEECRIALHLAGVDFEDARVKFADWPALKPKTPFGSLPTLDVPGHRTLAQSNAILVYVGRGHGLHPKEDFEAARHEAMMSHVEDLRTKVSPTMRIQDEAAKKAAREEIATQVIPPWAASAEGQLGDGPFFAGAKLHVVDIKLFILMRWFVSGALDHVPTTVFDGSPKLMRLYDAVKEHAGVKAWLAKR